MDGASAKKSTSFETLVIQNISNVNDLKSKLKEIIKAGKDYEYDVSNCLKSLITNGDQDIVLLSVQAISELAKCESKREIYAQEDVIKPILHLLTEEITTGRLELLKQCCRSLGNLCCDCDIARKIILDNNGVPVLAKMLKKLTNSSLPHVYELKILVIKTIMNFSIGGVEFSKAIIDEGVVETFREILFSELNKFDPNDELLSSILLVLSVVNDNDPEFLFSEELNLLVLTLLKETSNLEISELCLEHFHTQAEHDSVKTLLARRGGGAELICRRLEQLLQPRDRGADVDVNDADVVAVIKQACDLLIIILTGDEAMELLYDVGAGEVYSSVVRWLDSPDRHLLATAVLAVGNFARRDDYCVHMMENNIFDKLLDIFETHHECSARAPAERPSSQPGDGGGDGDGDGDGDVDSEAAAATATATKITHAALAALRNLVVPARNKAAAAAGGRAAPALLRALPAVRDHHVAYKLLAALRMLVDGQDGVSRLVARDAAALRAAGRWGRARDQPAAASEAPRLLAWLARQLRRGPDLRRLLQEEDCISSLVNMLVSSHSVMQNEAILALTLMAIESLNETPPAPAEQPHDVDCEKNFIAFLIKAEIGKHVSVLMETNCAKMPVEVAENLLAFLDITSKKNKIALDYKEANVCESLRKFADARKDLSEDLRGCIAGVLKVISGHGDPE